MICLRSGHEESSKIQLLTANLTGVVSELITQAIQQQPDIESLGNAREWSEVEALIGKATVFMIGFEDEAFSSETCLSLLNDHPQLKILILRANSNEGFVYWLALHCKQMQVVSAQNLIASIRYIHSSLDTDMGQCSEPLERNG